MNKKQITSTLTIDPLVVEALRRYARQYALSQIFPDDPLLGDFALFGYGVNHA